MDIQKSGSWQNKNKIMNELEFYYNFVTKEVLNTRSMWLGGKQIETHNEHAEINNFLFCLNVCYA